MIEKHKRVLVIGGPNGAGKTTAAMTLLPRFLDIHEFVNADEIARGLNPLNPNGQAVASARLMIERVRRLTREGKSFALETTCSGLSPIAQLKRCKTLGYEVILVFLWLPSAEMAIRRVAQRVKQGGHDIPPDVIRRRYVKGLKHLVHHYLPMADYAEFLDSSENAWHTFGMCVIAKKESVLEIQDAHKWNQIIKVASG